ncbi:MAG: long-chain fatty acid--CoA ligase [Alphaproteobacteria bacterium]|nr:long-chain fatty acid--CoA ligase [Alphaproteobacteria bacterium]
MYLTQGLKRARQFRGNGRAVIFGERSRTWNEVVDRIARLAGLFRSLGLADGDRVAMLAHSSDRYLEFYYAPLWAGGVMVPLNTRLAVPETVALLEDCTPAILLVDDAFRDQVPDILRGAPCVRHVIWAGEGPAPEGMIDYEAAIAATAPIEDRLRGGNDLACLFYTGGTTGRSKGVMLSHDNLSANSMNAFANMGFNEDTVHLHSGPLFHLAAGSRVYTVTLCAGTHVIIPRFTPEAFLEAIQRHRVNAAVIVPTMATMILALPNLKDYDLSSIESFSYGAAPMPEALVLRVMELLPHARLLQSYGMTELSPVCSTLPHRYHATTGPRAGKLNSAGRATYSAEMRIVDAEDRELPPGEIGEIVVRGPMVMLGYWNQPEQTAEALRGGWMHTGDAGYMDEEGFVFLVDRVKDMIITGGENVYSTEVENAIYKHPSVRECAVIGIPDERWGEAVHAIVVPRAGCEIAPEEVIEHCRTLIAGYKCPRSVEVRSEPLPLSPANKIHKVVLREPYWKGRARRVN